MNTDTIHIQKRMFWSKDHYRRVMYCGKTVGYRASDIIFSPVPSDGNCPQCIDKMKRLEMQELVKYR